MEPPQWFIQKRLPSWDRSHHGKLHERQEEELFPELLRQAQEKHHSQGWYFHQVPSDTQAVTNIALLLPGSSLCDDAMSRISSPTFTGRWVALAGRWKQHACVLHTGRGGPVIRHNAWFSSLTPHITRRTFKALWSRCFTTDQWNQSPQGSRPSTGIFKINF